MKSEKFRPNAAYLTFLSRLRLARQEANCSQRELARRLSWHHSRVVRSEAALRALDIIEVRAICLAIGLNVVEFTRELDAALGASEDNPSTDVEEGTGANSPAEEDTTEEANEIEDAEIEDAVEDSDDFIEDTDEAALDFTDEE